jgi:ectoine hydroxylase-related dioxygenase (phytanoyl-CoA dioxygenase family)
VDDRGNYLPKMFHYPSMWAIRQYPAVHAAFADLLGTEALWVSIANLCIKLPENDEHPEYAGAGFIHWDRLRYSLTDPRAPIDTSKDPDSGLFLSGLVALRDTTEEMGGFQCVPEIYRDLDAWIAGQPNDWDPRKPDLTGYSITSVPMKAGDLCIWTTRLPHGNGNNVSDVPRLAQYVTMAPAPVEFPDYPQRRARKVASWQAGQLLPVPAGYSRRESHLPPAELSELGRRLVGADDWR